MKPLIELNLPHGPEQLQFFRSVREATPDNAIIVEIGSYVGAIGNQFIGGNRKVFCIDPWEEQVYSKDDPQYALIEDAINNRGGINNIYETWLTNAGSDLFVNIFPIKGYSQNIAKFFNLPIDLLYLDGCHNYESVKRDIELWVPKVKNGGIIMGDDYGGFFTGVTKAVDEYFPTRQIYHGNQFFYTK